MKHVFLLALSVFVLASTTNAQDDRFTLGISSSDIDEGGVIRGVPGEKVTINISVNVDATEAGVAGVVAPVSVTSPAGPGDVTITNPDCDATCASEKYGAQIFFYNVDVVDPSFEDQGNGIILGLTTNIITNWSYPVGNHTVLDFTFELTVPEEEGTVVVGFKNGLKGVGTRQNVTLTVAGASVVPQTSELTFSIGPAAGGLIPGDTNLSGKLDVTDVVMYIDHYFIGMPTMLPCGDGTVKDAGNIALLDSNGDGELDISDAIYTLRAEFLGGAPHVLGKECVEISGCDVTSCDIP